MLLERLAVSDLGNAHIFFNHIPKTGGTSLFSLVSDMFGPDQCFRHMNRDGLTGTYSPGIETLSDEQLTRFRFLGGHLPFNAADRLRSLGRRVFHITVLRDPVERTVSDYYFNRKNGAAAVRELAQSMDLNAYVRHRLKESNGRMRKDVQCWYVCGEPDFDRARKTLDDNFILACTIDQLDDMQVLLAATFSRLLYPPRRRNASDRERQPTLDPELAAMVREASQNDLRLIDYVREDFARLLRTVSAPAAPTNA